MRLPAHFRLSAILIITVLAASFAFAAPAKKRKPAAATPVPEQTPSGAPASIRLWMEEFGNGKKVRLELMPKNAKDAAVRFEPPAAGPHFTEYAECPAGAATMALSLEDAAGEKPKLVPIALAPGSFTTLICRARDGLPTLEVVDDAPAGAGPGSAELTVRNFAPGLTEIRVQAGDNLTARMRAPEAFVNMRGFEQRRCQIDIVTRDTAGKESSWTTEIDFSTVPKGTLLIYSDPYGRIRPRVVPDGQPPLGSGSPEAKPTPAP